MSDSTSSSNDLAPVGLPARVATFLGIIGTILVFVLVMFLAYLPNRAEPVDAELIQQRKNLLSETRADGISKLNQYAVINADEGTVKIPVERAMSIVLREYAERGSAE